MENSKILGFSASPRSRITKENSGKYIENLLQIKSDNDLICFLQENGENKNLSNSDIILSAGLWQANQLGSDIKLCCDSDFSVNELKSCDGIVLSTPVYFGDRSAISDEFIRKISQNNNFGKIYAGLASGAKRNGGQETTLIYQIFDMINAGFLSVGNDSETTAQYGGTCHAGNMGTAWKDDYGIWTAKGVGRRIAKVCYLKKLSEEYSIRGKIKIGIFILQKDKLSIVEDLIYKLSNTFKNSIDVTIFDITDKTFDYCLACDICPSSVGPDETYRCSIKNKNDWFLENHNKFLELDAILPIVYCDKNSNKEVSHYQRFIERTRYLRRGDYLFSDIVVCPIVINEIGNNNTMLFRIITSMIRHHTIIHNPIAIYTKNNIFYEDLLWNEIEKFIKLSRIFTAGRLARSLFENEESLYNPVGYILQSGQNNKELLDRKKFLADRNARLKSSTGKRILKTL